jgi:hypothetical protein
MAGLQIKNGLHLTDSKRARPSQFLFNKFGESTGFAKGRIAFGSVRSRLAWSLAAGNRYVEVSKLVKLVDIKSDRCERQSKCE